MPEHVHLLLSEPQEDTPADALKSVKQGVSRRLIRGLPLKPKAGLNEHPSCTISHIPTKLLSMPTVALVVRL